jgi:hypothetical protein
LPLINVSFLASVMVNFRYQLDWAKRCSDKSKVLFLGVYEGVGRKKNRI